MLFFDLVSCYFLFVKVDGGVDGDVFILEGVCVYLCMNVIDWGCKMGYEGLWWDY